MLVGITSLIEYVNRLLLRQRNVSYEIRDDGIFFGGGFISLSDIKCWREITEMGFSYVNIYTINGSQFRIIDDNNEKLASFLRERVSKHEYRV